MSDSKITTIGNPLIWLSGASLFEQSKYKEATKIFEKLPTNAKVLYNIAMCYLNGGDYVNAIKYLKSSIESDKYLSIGYFQLGYCYHITKEFHQASKNYEATLMFLGETEEIRFHDLGLKCVIIRWEVLYNLALSLRQAGDKDACQRAITQVRNCPKNSDTTDLEMMLGKLETGWVKDLLPFSVNIKAVFRSSTGPAAGSSISVPSSQNASSMAVYPTNNSSTFNPNATLSSYPVRRDLVIGSGRGTFPPNRAPPPTPPPRTDSPIRIGDVKLRSKSDASALRPMGNPLIASSSTGSIKETLSSIASFKERETTKPRSGSEPTNSSSYFPKPSSSKSETAETKEERKKRKEEKKRRKEKDEIRKSGEKKSKEEKKRNSKEEKEKEKRRGSHSKKDASLNREIENHLAKLDLRTSRDRTGSDPHERPNSMPVPHLTSGAAAPALVRRVLSQDHEPHSEPDSPRSIEVQWEINFQEIHLGKEIGAGAFGRVYEGTWRNAPCCVKVANPETSREAMNEFLKEANSMKKLRSHPNVCQFFGVCFSPTTSIVMELLPEGSLHKIVHEPSHYDLDLNQIMGILKDVCSGMTHLHAEGILHLDLATRNLLVKSEVLNGKPKYTIKISDFGMSSSLVNTREIYDVSSRNKFPIRWCAPEIAHRRQVTKASDVWSFAVVAWEILERMIPYPDMSNQEVIEAVFTHGYRLPKPTKIQFPEELYSLMLRCWSADPAGRPRFPQIFEELKKIESTIKFFKTPTVADSNARANYGPIWNHLSSNPSSSTTNSPTSSFISQSTLNYLNTDVSYPVPQRTLSSNTNDQDFNSSPLVSRPAQVAPIPESEMVLPSGSPKLLRRFCSSCGKNHKPADCFCSYCGNKLKT